MPELTDAQKVLRNDTGKRMADALEALAGTGARGLPAGGTDGDVLVKNGATDYAATWKKTPPQMGSLAYINAGSTADRSYQTGEYLVYNGQLYKVGSTTIGQGETLTPGGNINAATVGGNIAVTDLSAQITGESSVGTLNGVSCRKRGNIVSLNIQINLTSDVAQYGFLAYNLPKQIAGADIIYGYLVSSNTMVPLYLRSGTSLAARVSITTRGILLVSLTYMTTDN